MVLSQRCVEVKCKRPLCPLTARRGGLCQKHGKAQGLQRAAEGGYTPGYVPADEAKAHLAKLRVAGLGSRRIAELAGFKWAETVQCVNRRTWLHARTAAKILAVPVPEIPFTVAMDGARVPAIGTTRRMRALIALGYTQWRLAEMMGSCELWVRDVLNGPALVEARYARRADEVFRELQVRPMPKGKGPSRSRNYATKCGWVVPLAWDPDTIDDPNAKPYTPKSDRQSWLDEYEQMKDRGLANQQIAKELGITRDALQVRLRRWRERNVA